jgi:hypothetical protein
MNKSIVIADSFSVFLSQIQWGTPFVDTPETFYWFGCPLNDYAVEATCKRRDITPETFNKVMDILLPAFQDGRVWFNEYTDESKFQLQRECFQDFLDTVSFRTGNPRIVFEQFGNKYWEAHICLPPMRELLKDNEWNVTYAFRNY